MANLSRIELLKQKLQAEKTKKDNGGVNYSNDIYPFWLMEVGESARVRILPDKNEDNDFIFFTDRLEHTLAINGEDKKIPCRAMYGEECPVCTLSRKLYKEQGKDSKDGKYYYRKKHSILRVLVIEDPLPPNKDTGETYEGKTVNTQFGFQLMEKIKEQISSDDLGEFYDLNEGTDFIIKKTANGDYGTYTVGSQFARKSTAIDEDLQGTIELVDLATLLPKDLGFEKVQNMLQAHLNGEEYDDDDQKKPAKPAPKKEEAAKKKSVKVEESKQKDDSDDDDDDDDDDQKEPVKTSVKKAVIKEEPVDSGDDDDADGDDIIAKLRARKNKAAKK